MYAYQVGQPYNPNVPQFPEVIQYNYRGGEHELVLFLNNPSAEEINDVAKGEARFALYADKDLIFLLFKFGNAIDWSDAPYSYHLVPADQQQRAPETSVRDYVLLHVILVDAACGIVKALRVIGMQPPFAQALHRAINAQANMEWNSREYAHNLRALYDKYNSHQMVQLSKIKFTSKP